MVASVVILYRAITNTGSMCKVHVILVNAAALLLRRKKSVTWTYYSLKSIVVILIILRNLYCPSCPLYSKMEIFFRLSQLYSSNEHEKKKKERNNNSGYLIRLVVEGACCSLDYEPTLEILTA